MKNFIYLIFSLLIIICSNKVFSQEYNHPKSVVYDVARERYLISNNGSGQVLALSKTGELSIFIEDQFTSPRGMIVVGDTLFVVDVNYLKGFNLNDGTPVFELMVEGATKLVDITVDEEKNLFMTDIQQKKMFIYSLSDASLTPFNFTQSTYPNGIVYDKHKLYVTTYWAPAQIVVFDLEEWKETKHDFINNAYFDGIVTDGNGNFYVASWEDMGAPDGKGMILKFNENNITSFTEFLTGLSAPSDIYFNPVKQELAIPNFSADSVIFVPLQTDVKETSNSNDLFEIYLNENNTQIKINFKKEINSNSSFQVYNLFGQLIESRNINLNKNELILNCENYIQGLYFIKINNFVSKLLINR